MKHDFQKTSSFVKYLHCSAVFTRNYDTFQQDLETVAEMSQSTIGTIGSISEATQKRARESTRGKGKIQKGEKEYSRGWRRKKKIKKKRD